MSQELIDELKRQSQDLKMIRQELIKIINFMIDAESEVPEHMRRFMSYMHDLHHIKHFYEEHGLTVPVHVMRECERCDDRLRQLLTKLHTDGGTFERVRREMAQDPFNRWDHTRQLESPRKENGL